MKKIAIIAGVLLVVGYLVFSLSFFKEKPGEEICKELNVVISNAEADQFIDKNEVENIIKESVANPLNKLLADVNTIEIEELVLKNQHVKKAEVYITNKNGIRVVLEERKPIIRIIPDVGESYYIDSEAEKMPLSRRYAAYVPVATGSIKDSFAKEDLYKFALFLQKNEFWNAQVEQIVVKPNNDITFVPRVGNHTIVLGSIDKMEEKLDKLMTFYQEGLNRIGWNKYSTINVKYNKQVVGTRQ